VSKTALAGVSLRMAREVRDAMAKDRMATEKEQVALSSILASAGLTAAKAAVGLASGSLAILSEAGHSLLDLLATVMTYFAVRVSDKPADEEHHYGHGKFESVAALGETALLFLLSVVVLWEAGHRLIGGQGHAIEASLIAFAVVIGSIVVDFFRARALTRVAKQTASEALEADALHFSSDMWSSAAVLLGLGGVALGFEWADSLAAVIVAVFICVAGWRLGKRTIDTLTDMAPSGLAQDLRRLVGAVAGVVSVERVRARKVGAISFVDIDVAASRTLPLDRVAAIKEDIARRVRDNVGRSEITITVDPRALDSETMLERVMVIARNRALAVHHITVHEISGRLSISLDLEVDGALPLGAAHDIASGLEAAIRDELGPNVEVDTHIEPLETEAAGSDAAADRVKAVTAELAQLAQAQGFLRDIHDVRVRETADGEIVNFHCYVDPSRAVHDVHEHVDEVERGLRRKFPNIKRVIGHAEPRM
jgi:cation diffusion facilitator family transporter